MLHRYGLQLTYEDSLGLIGWPILRLPVPDNPKPDELTYAAFRNVLKTFVANLEMTEATLAKIKSKEVDLPLNIGLIRLDLNGDGQGAQDEALWRIFAVVAGSDRWLNEEAAQKLLTDFDGSDVPWLRAYCHLLMAIAEFPLAHDWQRAFEATFPSIFHMPKSRTQRKFDEALAEARAQLAEMGPRPTQPRRPPGMSHREWFESDEWKEYTRVRALRAAYASKHEYASIADLVAFVHLTHWPVVDNDRLARVLRHLEAVVGLSRENWKRILGETDNRNEWLPNLTQTGVLPSMPITQDRINGWHKFLDEFEAILRGTKLIPHWRFDEGINLRRMFLEPHTFDIVLLLHGSAAVPYLEKGPVTDRETWNQITQLFEANFFRYLIWFN
jgi:hypothetical protein